MKKNRYKRDNNVKKKRYPSVKIKESKILSTHSEFTH